ncbi:MAG: transcriptional repressor [Ruminococcus sp.]|nr:transcriptional repressor [Ruminococcus sp.]
MERSSGYRTRQKEQIHAYLLANRARHFTAQNISDYLSAQGSPVAAATIYRYLEQLVERGEIRKYYLDEKSGACFEYVGADDECRSHFHLKCVCCNRLIHTDCDFLQELDGHIFDHHGFHVDHSKTVLYGICRDCSESEEEKN